MNTYLNNDVLIYPELQIKKINLKKKEERPVTLKAQASSQSSPVDTQLSEIEKQLKSIQNQKKEITKIISKDLRERKSRWPEVKDRGSFFNMRELVHKAEDKQTKRIRDSLASSIQEVRNFGDSLSNGMVGSQNKRHGYRGDNEKNPGVLLKDALVEKPAITKSILNRTMKPSFKSPEKVNDSGLELTRDFSRMGIMEDQDYSVLQKKNEAALKSIFEDQETKMIGQPQSFKNIHRPDQDVSSQANSSLVKKYPVLQNMLPEVFKSEFMKKSCCFD